MSIHRVKREFNEIHSKNNFNLIKDSENGIEMIVSGKSKGDKYRYRYRYFLNMFHMFSLLCFLIYGVKSRSGHDRSQSFCPISHVSDPKLTF